jgi:hypothetical protein
MTARSHIRASALLLAQLLLILIASTACATPSLRYSWDDCDPLVLDREFTGPQHYVQTLSVTGLTQPLTVFRVIVVFGPSWPDAWRFDDLGCQGSSRLTATTTAAGCESVPSLTVTVSMHAGVTEGRFIEISGVAPAGPAPDPSARYALVRLDFDHSASIAGSSAPPGKCAGADFSECFGIESASLNGSFEDPVLENGMLTWNVPSTPGVCPFRVATRAATWGRLKAIYR